MDPNQTFLDMYAAMQSGDLETARELALALKQWFAKGGFYPYQFTPEAMHAYIATVLRRTAGHGPEVEFSIVCRSCDAGKDIQTKEQAMAAGWSQIEPAFALPQASYSGVCPDCNSSGR